MFLLKFVKLYIQKVKVRIFRSFEDEKKLLNLVNCTYEKWQFTNANGVIDGKYISHFQPHYSASNYRVTRDFLGFVLMVLWIMIIDSFNLMLVTNVE